MAKLLTRDEILGADDLRSETVPVAPWGGSVIVRTLTGAQRDEYETTVAERRTDGRVDIRELKALLVVYSVVNAEGKPLFSPKDAASLNATHGGAIDLLFRKAQDLNGISDAQVDELAKN